MSNMKSDLLVTLVIIINILSKSLNKTSDITQIYWKKIHTGIIYLKCHYTAFSSDIPNLKSNYSYICGNAMQLTMHSILSSHAYFDICVHWTRSNIFTIWMKISAFDARLMSGQGARNWNQMLCISCLQLLLQGLFKSRIHILREGIIQRVCITKDITYWMFKQLYF